MDEISLLDILKIIYRRKVIVLITLVLAIVAVVIVFNLKNENNYEFAATIYTKGDYLDDKQVVDSKNNQGKSEDTIIKELQIGEQLTKDYMNFLDSTYVLTNIQIKLKEKYAEFADYSSNDLNNFIKSKITIKSKGEDSRFLVVSVTDKDPELAKDIVKFTSEELKKSAVEVLGAGSVNIVDISLVAKSNDTMKNAGITFAIILLIGMMIVFIVEFADGSLKAIEQMESIFGIDVIGDVPEY